MIFCATCLLASAAILFYIVRYRIHIHISYSPRPQRTTDQGGKEGRTRLGPRPSLAATNRATAEKPEQSEEPAGSPATSARRRNSALVAGVSDIQSALVNLGCSKEKARSVATRVCAQPGTFEEQLRRALQEAA